MTWDNPFKNAYEIRSPKDIIRDNDRNRDTMYKGVPPSGGEKIKEFTSGEELWLCKQHDGDHIARFKFIVPAGHPYKGNYHLRIYLRTHTINPDKESKLLKKNFSHLYDEIVNSINEFFRQLHD